MVLTVLFLHLLIKPSIANEPRLQELEDMNSGLRRWEDGSGPFLNI